MEIRHLRYFVAVAETLSFTKAARDLHMSQPPLSKRIQDMEAELGIKLFDRGNRKVTLTPTGTALLRHAQGAVRAFDAAVRVARLTATTATRRLRIALPTETSREVLVKIVERLGRDGVEVDLTEATTADQQRLLLAAEIDLGVLRHPFEQRGLKLSAPLQQPLGVLMHSSHPLAAFDEVTLPDLQPYPLVHFHRHLAPGLHDELLDLCREGGFRPTRILHGIRMTASLLKLHPAVSLTTKSLFDRRGAAAAKVFVWRPLRGEPLYWRTAAVCRTKDWDSLARLSMGVVVEALKLHDGWIPVTRFKPEASRQASRESMSKPS